MGAVSWWRRLRNPVRPMGQYKFWEQYDEEDASCAYGGVVVGGGGGRQ